MGNELINAFMRHFTLMNIDLLSRSRSKKSDLNLSSAVDASSQKDSATILPRLCHGCQSQGLVVKIGVDILDERSD
jgi:hypothetical protein